MELTNADGRTVIKLESIPNGRIKLRYHAGFYPTGAAVAVQLGDQEVIVNPADTAVAAMLDRLSRQREVAILDGNGRVTTIAHGRMARQQLQQILDRTAAHLPTCRLDWQQTLADFLA